MNEFRAKMAENGRVIIPAACRRLLNIKPGEDLILFVEDHELRILSLQHALHKAQAIVQRHAKNKSLVKKLKNMRQSELDHE